MFLVRSRHQCAQISPVNMANCKTYVIVILYKFFRKMRFTVADPGGVPPVRTPLPPPQGSRFFHFDIQNFRNVAASGVGAPLRGWRPPYGKSWIRRWFRLVIKHRSFVYKDQQTNFMFKNQSTVGNAMQHLKCENPNAP